jgi:hypothetical protein
MNETADRSRIVRLRRTAKRRGYTLHKTRRIDPLATDYGTWTIKGPGAPRRLLSTDEVEAFLNNPPKERT